MLKEASPEQFLDALDPTIPGMKGRMLLDEAMGSAVDWMQCKSTMCCLACALELRCCKVSRCVLLRSYDLNALLARQGPCVFCRHACGLWCFAAAGGHRVRSLYVSENSYHHVSTYMRGCACDC